jgi:PASTA domain
MRSQEGKAMDFLGSALPNVMFVVGVLAIGLGLGIELKVVPLNKEIDRTGRIGAMVLGAVLVAISLYIYLNPSLINHNQAAVTTTNSGLTGAEASATLPTTVSRPTEAAVAIEAATVEPSAAPVATPEPTATPVPSVAVPDLHGLSEKDAQDKLSTAGLRGSKVDRCTGSDQGEPKTKKHQIQCQNPAANAAVPLGTSVEYVLR